MNHSRREQLISLLERLPTAGVSRLMGRLSRTPVPRPLRAPLWRLAAGRLGMDLSEAAGDPTDYRSFDELFTRSLRPGVRPVAEHGVRAPADGRLTQLERVGQATRVGVKGRSDDLAVWLGRADLPWTSPCVAVVYLSPKDYHRVHAPIDGDIVELVYTPGTLIPVNPIVAGDGRLVFGRNERLTFWLSTRRGPVGVAMVGALGVGGITVLCHPLRANRSACRSALHVDLTGAPVAVRAGDELGTFHLGSSVVVAWEGGGYEWSADKQVGGPVRMGQRLGDWTA